MTIAASCTFSPSSDSPAAPREKLTLKWRGKADRLPDVGFVEVVEQAAPPAAHVAHVAHIEPLEIVPPAFDKPSPYATLMACWVDYMRTDDRDLGAGSMRLSGEGAADRNVHEQQRAADIKLGEAVGAMVDSLTIQHRWAIYKSQGISRGWRFPNADYDAVLMAARDTLEEKLQRNVATRLYFE